MALQSRIAIQSEGSIENNRNTDSNNFSKLLKGSSVKAKPRTSNKTETLKKTDIKSVETLLLEITLEIKGVGITFTEKMAETHNSILCRMIVLCSGSMIAIIGMFVAIFMQLLSFHT